MLASVITQPPPVRVARRRAVAVRFPVAASPARSAQRRAAAQLVLGRRCRRRAVR